jgi:hypothetical protein
MAQVVKPMLSIRCVKTDTAINVLANSYAWRPLLLTRSLASLKFRGELACNFKLKYPFVVFRDIIAIIRLILFNDSI